MDNSFLNAVSVLTAIAREDTDIMSMILNEMSNDEVIPTLLGSIVILEGVVKHLLEAIDEGSVEENYTAVLQQVAVQIAELYVDDD